MLGFKEALFDRTYLTLAVAVCSNERTLDGRSKELVRSLWNFGSALFSGYDGDYEVKAGYYYEKVPQIVSQGFNAPPWTDRVECKTISFKKTEIVKLERPNREE